ncbi:MAG: hypothetical protein IKP14_00170 [Clostridiales bacterium]|nr:hypothetical protein [Clostridiales bacterium]
MKKALSLVLTAAIGVSCLAACSKEPAETETSAAETTVEETQTAETTEAPETTAAETTEASETAADTEVTPELNDLFEQALQGFVGVGYTPEFYLGSFDNGDTIHCFLCESTTITANPVSYWSFVFVLDDGAGNVSIAKVCQPDYECINVYDGDFLATEVQTEPVPGGWEETMDFEVTDDRLAEFRLANSIYMPVALLATQVVAGMNYIYLATDADGNFRIVEIYVDLDGGACTSGSKSLNIESLY